MKRHLNTRLERRRSRSLPAFRRRGGYDDAFRKGLLLLLFLIAPAPLFAQTATVYHIPGLYYQQYTPDSAFSTEIDFTVAQRGSGQLDFFITVDGGDTNSFDPRYATAQNGAQLEYYIFDNLNDRNVLRDDGNLSASEVITGTFSSSDQNARKTKNYAIFVPAGQYAANAQYSDDLTFTVYTGTVDNYDPATAVTESVTINLAVPKMIEVRLDDPGGTYEGGAQSYSLDFGNFFPGETQAVDLLVNSTVQYYVAFSSNNGGAFSRSGGSATVPYTFDVDGSTVSLSSGYNQPITGESPTTNGPRSYLLEFTVGSLSGAPEGQYTETVTIDVVSQ